MNVHRLFRAFKLLALSALLFGGVAQAQDPDHGRVINGVAIYFGCIPAEIIDGEYLESTPEHQMHGGIPKGSHYHHVLVAIFDNTTGQRITDAKITARVAIPTEPNVPVVEKALEPMTLSGASAYGEYFKMPGKGMYQVKVTITIPNRPVITTTFQHEHD